ncbi:hypothetical protein [Nitrospirillum sp. BR 11163]|uniref:hypothetical protein n=1 Tax=Nitrospirillum sp. BR 11163 TaxID=3104323 RepID=UPI002AFF372C|nr:hypothetical protein [Nitrospirillum sp. BR 11163]MEA1677154.1 hypothetical protein [Nitrospirillum sp. BR 11163]
MNGASHATYGHRLAPPQARPGVVCDDQGPLWNSIRLLVRTTAGWAPRPTDELGALVTAASGRAVDARRLHARLSPIARALNEGHLARAVIGAQYLDLPPSGSTPLAKASPDDPAHPGWEAGAPDGKGGQFRPKDGGLSEADQAETDAPEPKPEDTAALREAVKTTAQRAVRRAFRQTAIELLTRRRLGRIALELAFNAVPVLDVLGDAALLVDLAELGGRLKSLAAEVAAVHAFAEAGVRTAEELMVTSEEISFSSYDAFKKTDLPIDEIDALEKRYGSAGPGYDYHHIVEQSAIGDGIPAELVNSTRNIVRMPRILHEEVTAAFNRPAYKGAPMSLREYLKTAPFEERMRKGMEVMRSLGLVK